MAHSSTAGFGIALIASCFIASAALRATGVGVALAGSTTGDAPAEALEADRFLAAIREREAQLEAEAARLAERAETLALAEERLEEQIAAFEKAQAGLEETLALADGAAERDIARMTAVYERMKPGDAARIFETMEVSFASGLLIGMKPETAALVLANMEPQKAYAITVMATGRNAAVPTE